MKTLFTALLICLAFTLTACNTIKGVGQDVQKAGSVIENAVKK
ncbi:MAG: entericidin A/B family lipoprotein [Polaromonas sp.]|nr:entericidin A/B family lipoprotein [Polaromonas sp.]